MKSSPILLSFFVVVMIIPPMVTAAPNLGMLRVSSFICPRQVAPGSSFPVSLDIEYAVQGLPNNATIRGAIYPGNTDSGTPLWQSDPVSVSNGGDAVWNSTLTAPSTGGSFDLTAYALFLENGTWTYFSNSVNGPGLSQASIKIGKWASLNINIGAPGVTVTVNGTTAQTSSNGLASFPVEVSATTTLSVPPSVEFQNSTRIIFSNWSDGVRQPERQVYVDGDVNLTAYYRTQYLLTLNAGPSTQQWYDNGANATITAPPPASVLWPLNAFGVTQSFEGWSGSIQSSSPEVNVTMNSPKTVTAEFATDYRPLAVPGIFAIGIIALIISMLMVQRRSRLAESNVSEAAADTIVPSSTCPTCGQTIESEWRHCIKCGTKLKDRSEAKTQPESSEKLTPET